MQIKTLAALALTLVASTAAASRQNGDPDQVKSLTELAKSMGLGSNDQLVFVQQQLEIEQDNARRAEIAQKRLLDAQHEEHELLKEAMRASAEEERAGQAEEESDGSEGPGEAQSKIYVANTDARSASQRVNALSAKEHRAQQAKQDRRAREFHEASMRAPSSSSSSSSSSSPSSLSSSSSPSSAPSSSSSMSSSSSSSTSAPTAPLTGQELSKKYPNTAVLGFMVSPDFLSQVPDEDHNLSFDQFFAKHGDKYERYLRRLSSADFYDLRQLCDSQGYSLDNFLETLPKKDRGMLYVEAAAKYPEEYLSFIKANYVAAHREEQVEEQATKKVAKPVHAYARR